MKAQFQGTAREAPLTAVIGAALRKVPVVHLGETDHRYTKRFNKLMGDPRTMRTLAAQGVRKIYLEIPQNQQPLNDALVTGRIDSEAFVDNASESFFRDKSERREEAAIILAAAKEGIRVLCADDVANGVKALERYGRAMNRITGHSYRPDQWFGGELPLEVFARKAEWIEKIKDPAKAEEARRSIARQFKQAVGAHGRYLADRLDDRRTARFIAKDLAPGEKALIVFGARHGKGERGMRALLETQGLPSLKIDVYPNKKILAENIGNYAKGVLEADGLYLLTQQRFQALNTRLRPR